MPCLRVNALSTSDGLLFSHSQLSAWVLGALRARPDAKVHLAWMNSWMDPALESYIITQFHRLGCDVMQVRADSIESYIVADNLGIKLLASVFYERFELGLRLV